MSERLDFRMRCDACRWVAYRVRSADAPCRRCDGTLRHVVATPGGRFKANRLNHLRTYLPDEHRSELERQAIRLGERSTSALVARILAEWIAQHQDQECTGAISNIARPERSCSASGQRNARRARARRVAEPSARSRAGR